jgi:hypothetical protein
MGAISMKRLLLLACGIASALCLCLVAAQAEVTPTTQSQPLQYSRPAVAGLLAQAPTETFNPYITMCLKGCDQEYAACHQRNPGDSGCGATANTCKEKCRK